MKYTFLFTLLLCGSAAFTQFTEISSQFGILLTGNTVQSGCGASMYDYDYDGWDDLTLGQPFNPILVYHNNQGNYEIAAVFDNNGDPKQLTWVDFDNDGDADFFFSVRGQGCKLYRNDGNMSFTNITANLNQPITNGMSFGCSWGDYNNDSFLDVYICNYSQGPSGHSNWLLRNNGDGTFTNVTTEMGVGNGNRPTYQSAWIDVNLDGLLDLYVVNDFDWLNELYLNNGTTFDAAGAAWNLNVAMEGMSNSWTDLEGDGDFDVFISNNVQGNVLLRNDNNVMTDIAASAGVLVNSTCWGSLWMDYDHDGHDDLHVATSLLSVNGNQNYLFHNNGDYTFTDESLAGDALIVFSTVKGDQNNDGWWDFLEMRQYPAAIALWQNNGGSNNWMKFRLEGTASNREGVGAIIRYYYPGKTGMLQTHSGEGYLAQDSQWEIVSMADQETLDSLTVTWPSGWVDRYYDLNALETYVFTEGETYEVSINAPQGDMLCASGGALELFASEGESYLWSDGPDTQSFIVFDPGVYSVVVTNEFGISATAEIEIGVLDPITIDVITEQPVCFGEANGCVNFSSPDGQIIDISWMEDRGDDNCSFAAGEYTAYITDQNNCIQSVFVEVGQPELLVIDVVADTACYGGATTVAVSGYGGTGDLSFEYVGGFDPAAVAAGDYSIVLSDENACEVTAEFTVSEYPQLVFEAEALSVCPDATGVLVYSVSGGIGEYEFDWDGMDPEALPTGDYLFSVIDETSCEAELAITVNSYPVMTVEGQVQNAQGGDNGSVLLVVTGGTQPFLFDWVNGATGNPLVGIGQGVYEVTVTDANDCTINAEFNIIDTFIDELNRTVNLYPNPADNFVKIEGLNPNSDIRVFDMQGKLVSEMQSVSNSLILETESFKAGVYCVVAGEVTSRFVIRHAE